MGTIIKTKQNFSVDHGSIKGMGVAMTTPGFIPPAVHRGVETAKPTTMPMKAKPVGMSARNAAYGKAMNSAIKNTKSY